MFEFSLADTENRATWFRTRAENDARRAAFFEAVRDKLTAAGVEKVSDLPKEGIVKLADLAREMPAGAE